MLADALWNNPDAIQVPEMLRNSHIHFSSLNGTNYFMLSLTPEYPRLLGQGL